jgi:hypothetical protein
LCKRPGNAERGQSPLNINIPVLFLYRIQRRREGEKGREQKQGQKRRQGTERGREEKIKENRLGGKKSRVLDGNRNRGKRGERELRRVEKKK